MAGLGSAAVSELLTQQSVMSQLLGRCADAWLVVCSRLFFMPASHSANTAELQHCALVG